jgi:hypothetical protein
MIGHGKPERPFHPTGKGGGSKKDKPQREWPLIAVVVADAVHIRFKGTIDKAIACKKAMPGVAWAKALNTLMPGWEAMALETQGLRATPYSRLLFNRVYKMYWENGKAVASREQWFNKVPHNHPYKEIHDKILNGEISVLENWKELWERDAQIGRKSRQVAAGKPTRETA